MKIPLQLFSGLGHVRFRATRKLIGARELGMMKSSAILINTCRCPAVDGAALYEALSSGKIAAAGLDVFEEEPTSPTNRPIRCSSSTT